MTYWVITDTHFGHEKMHEHCDRPIGFEDRILSNVDRIVREGDVLIHLGDICIGKDQYWNLALHAICKGSQWLIRGNHDKKSISWYLNNGWDCVADSITLNIFGESIVFSHKPVPLVGEVVNIHGHHHNTNHHPEDVIDKRHRLLCLEHHYSPVNLSKIISQHQISFSKCGHTR